MCMLAVLLLLNGFSVLFPGHWPTSTFLTSYIGFPAFLAIYFAHRVYALKDPWARDPRNIDLHSGLAEVKADCLEEESLTVASGADLRLLGIIKATLN